MNQLVRFLTDEDGFPEDRPELWHLVDPCNYQGHASLCHGQYFGYGESGIEFRTKVVVKGGITCPKCLAMVKGYKAVRL
jgi:hypothetical protein